MKPFYDHAGITIYHGDCRDILPSVTGDMVFADPPYGVGLVYASHEDSALVGFSWLDRCRALAPTIVTPGYRNLYAYPQADQVAIRFDRTAQSPAAIAWMNKWEPVLFYGKFKGRLAWDVIESRCQSERAIEPLDHPCPKPLEFVRAVLTAFEWSTVIDPFMGTGTTLRAAADLHRKAIGIEIEEKYCEIAALRLSQEVFDFSEAAS